MRFSSLRWRLFAAIGGAIVLSAVLCLLGALLFLNQALTERASADLRYSLDSAARLLAGQRAGLLRAAHLTAADPAVAVTVQAGDQAALLSRLSQLSTDLDAGFIDVLDRHGHVLAQVGDAPAFSDGNMGLRPSVRAALQGHATVDFEPDLPGRRVIGYALRASVPLREGARISGVVVVGRHFDSTYARTLSGVLDASVTLIAGRGSAGSLVINGGALRALAPHGSASMASRIASGKITTAVVRENGQAILSGLIPLHSADGRPVGAIEVLRPLPSLNDALVVLLLALGACAVVAGTLLAWRIVRRLTARLITLEATAARAVETIGAVALPDLSPGRVPLETVQATGAARGGLLHAGSPRGALHGAVARGDDEVASLARSFDAMMAALEGRMEANERLYAAAQARVRELTGLAEIARLLTADSSLDETLHELGEHVCRLVGCAATAIDLPATQAQPALCGGYGLPADCAALLAAPEGGDLDPAFPWQEALRTGTVCWSRLDTLPERAGAMRVAAQSLGWGGATAVPLRLHDRTVGVVVCFSSAPAPLSPADLSLLITIADQVAVAVERARLHAQSRQIAALEERARLARELHDSVTQALFSMMLHARATQMALQREGIDPQGPLGRGVAQLSELTQGALAEMRALIFELRPGALSEEGLVAALRKQAAALQAREGLDVEVEVEAPQDRLPLDAEAEEQLYRLAQEALHNVVKHAGARHVQVRVAGGMEGGAIVLEVSDDGAGFDTMAPHPGHLGLRTMAERARQVGGHLDIVSVPGHGTTVRAVIAQ